MWSGNGLNIIKMLPEGATKFGVYEVCEDFNMALAAAVDRALRLPEPHSPPGRA